MKPRVGQRWAVGPDHDPMTLEVVSLWGDGAPHWPVELKIVEPSREWRGRVQSVTGNIVEDPGLTARIIGQPSYVEPEWFDRDDVRLVYDPPHPALKVPLLPWWRRLWPFAFAVLALLGCEGDFVTEPRGSVGGYGGEGPATGGEPGTGGVTSSTGGAASGGVVSTGGEPSTGGAVGVGGSGGSGTGGTETCAPDDERSFPDCHQLVQADQTYTYWTHAGCTVDRSWATTGVRYNYEPDPLGVGDVVCATRFVDGEGIQIISAWTVTRVVDVAEVYRLQHGCEPVPADDTRVFVETAERTTDGLRREGCLPEDAP